MGRAFAAWLDAQTRAPKGAEGGGGGGGAHQHIDVAWPANPSCNHPGTDPAGGAGPNHHGAC